MPLTATTPIVDPNDATKSYPYLGIHLAIAPLWSETDVAAAVAARFVPYRVLDGGVIERREDLAKSISLGNAFVTALQDEATGTTLGAVMGALQAFIAAKGI